MCPIMRNTQFHRDGHVTAEERKTGKETSGTIKTNKIYPSISFHTSNLISSDADERNI